ncbi:PorP/SprF family type IX secretion system membrane protein [Bacteroides sp. UBA939]|uniref:PorP/SprF family type IX secretion system membrane protein n=1 Tax=Bacteroides sp. UBA939 TaxID=1946092 RepID=UPI0025B9384F|nr:PorP/SprF family type IX secretion system membrane protein [Bacteroides sp. UBA939]
MKHRPILKYTLLLSLFFCLTEGKAQFDARLSQYWAVPGYYHPASAGQTDNKLNAYAAYGMQLMGFTRAPRVMYFGADMPFTLFNKQHGAGVGLFNEGIGLFRNQRYWAQYAWQTKIRKSKLSIGLQVGMLNIAFDPTDIDLGDETDDEAFPTTAESGTSLDVGLSAYYSHPKFYAAFSAHHLTAPRISLGEKSHIKVHPILYLSGGYNIQTRNPLISIQPSMQLQSDFISTRLDVTGQLLYTYRSRVFRGGLTYSPNTSLTINLGLTIQGITLGYAYEYFTSKIGIASGSHDLVLRYALDLNLFKRSRNLHKSVRIL